MSLGLRLEGAARRVAGRLTTPALILLYHRVADQRPDPWSLAVRPEHFAAHLEILRRWCRPMRLAALVEAIRGGRIPTGAVAVTFDDGYADNLHVARPLLARHDVPATVFVASGMVGSPREFWWDALERLLLEPGSLPDRLELDIRGTHHSWSLGADAHYSREAADRDGGWVTWARAPSARQRLYLDVWRLLQPLAPEEQSALLEQLRRWAGRETALRPERRMLTADELRALAADGLIEIGAHTVTHPLLASQPEPAQATEIRQSKLQLEALLGRAVVSFAYPFGGYDDYTRTSVRLAREAGYTCAAAAVGGTANRLADHYQLPRLYLEDMDGERFGRLIRRHLHVRVAQEQV